MDKIKKAVWLSVLLTGAGQLYLGEKKKGWRFLIFSILGIVFSCIGIVLVGNTLLGFLSPSRPNVFLHIGFLLSAIGLTLILVLGYISIKDITSRNK